MEVHEGKNIILIVLLELWGESGELQNAYKVPSLGPLAPYDMTIYHRWGFEKQLVSEQTQNKYGY